MAAKIAHVNPLSVVPKYYQLSEILRQKIDDSEWQPNDPIPPERELESLYKVSRTTVREALNHLADQGYIYREHGRGTFVARPKIQHSLHILHSFTDDMKARGLAPGHQTLALDRIEPSDRIRQKLDLAPEVDQVVQIERLRYADNEPIGLHMVYLPLSPDQNFTADELQEVGSLYTLLESKFGLILAEADETLEATVAGARESQLLEVEVGSPLLMLERTTFSHHRRPMEFVTMLYRADRYKYYVHITRF